MFYGAIMDIPYRFDDRIGSDTLKLKAEYLTKLF